MSRVIKSSFAQTDEDNKRVIKLRPLSSDLSFFEEKVNLHEVQEEKPDLTEFQAQADAIIRDAEKEAVTILKQAENELQEMMHQIEVEKQNWEIEKQHWIEEARQEGYAVGVEVGRHDGYQEYKSLIETAQHTIEVSKQDYLKNVEQAETTILHLGLKTAEKIMGYTLELNPETFMNVVRNVIKEVKDHQDVQIRVHPLYYEFILSQKEELKALFSNPTTELFIYPDEELNETDCMIESSFGRIDASIDSQLQEMKAKLLQLLEGDLEDEDC